MIRTRRVQIDLCASFCILTRKLKILEIASKSLNWVQNPWIRTPRVQIDVCAFFCIFTRKLKTFQIACKTLNWAQTPLIRTRRVQINLCAFFCVFTRKLKTPQIVFKNWIELKLRSYGPEGYKSIFAHFFVFLRGS